MPPPSRLVEGGDEATRALMERGSETTAWSEVDQARFLRRLSAVRPASAFRSSVLAALAVTAASAGLLVYRRVSPATVDLPGLGSLLAGRNAQFAVSNADATSTEVHLSRGRLAFNIARHDGGRQLWVIAPGMRIRDVGTVFTVSSAGEITTVEVASGSVSVSSDGPPVSIGPGESIRSDDPRLHVAPRWIEPGPPREVSACPQGEGTPGRRSCLMTLSAGEGLGAQNATFALGVAELDDGDLAEALATWQHYQLRFPQGVFAPEVNLSTVATLAALGRYREALAEADQALAANRVGGATDRLRLLRANVLAQGLHQPRDAEQAYRALADSPDPRVRSEALRSLGQFPLQAAPNPR